MSLRDWLLMGVVALTWSGGWIASKIGVANAPPIALSAVRFLVAGAILLLIARATGAEVPWRRWPSLLALAVSGIAAYNALVFVGLVFAPASDGGLIVPTFTPILAAVLAVLFADEPLTREGVAGLALGLVGVTLVIVGGTDLSAGASTRLTGDILILGGALCWAVYTVVGKALLAQSSPLGITAAATLLGGMLLAALAALEGALPTLGGWPATAWLAIGYLVLFPTIVGFVGFYQLVVRLGAARAAMTSYLVPVGALILAAAILGERVAPLQLLGGLLTVAGMRVATLPDRDAFWLRRFVGI